jgi:prophage antirepressor-like protein
MDALLANLVFDGHRVRVVGSLEHPQIVAKDVCRLLQIHNTCDALQNAGVTAEEKGVIQIDTLGGPQTVTTVNEAGLWKLVLVSRKRGPAMQFKHWLATEVIPSLRKHGCYPPPDVPIAAHAIDLDDPSCLRALVATLAERRLSDQAKIAELTPKAEGYDRLSNAGGDVCLMDAGRILGRAPGLFVKQLRRDGVLFRSPGGDLEPHSDYRERGYFNVCAVIVGVDIEGKTKTKPQTRVTPRGLQWLAIRYPATDRISALTERTGKQLAAFLPRSH